MPAPRVSIITPTFNRPHFLPLLTKCVLDQSVSDFEWLILDDSPLPSKFMRELSDPRIIYEHINAKTSVGGKRNRLIQKSRAEIIAQFDDDDFYGQDYLAKMISALDENGVDIVKFFGFFLCSKIYKTFGYWDLMITRGPHWVWSTAAPGLVMFTEQNNQNFKDNHLGFGFSYVFKRAVWESSQFPEINFNEDALFIRKALQRFKLLGLQDDQCTCIHVLHEGNESQCYPQYMMPPFLVGKLFPKAGELLTIIG